MTRLSCVLSIAVFVSVSHATLAKGLRRSGVGRSKSRLVELGKRVPGSARHTSPIPRSSNRTTPNKAFPESSTPQEKGVLLLRDQLDGILKERPLSRAKVGVELVRMSDGSVLFAHNARLPFNPASNTKVLTTAAALAYLGGDYRYRTAIFGPLPDTSGIIHGDVALRGSGDPSLVGSDLAEIAHRLTARGVTRIDGDLIADPRISSLLKAHDSPVSLGEGGLILNRNTYAVHVRPTTIGRAPVVSIDPSSDFFAIENHAVTSAGKRSRLRIDSYRTNDHLVISLRGRIAESRGEVVDLRRLADGSLYAAATLRAVLSDFGIEVTGKVRSDSPTGGQLLAEHMSAPLADICRISNKPSNNFVAEAIYKTLGRELYGLPVSSSKGARAITEYLTEIGINQANYRIVNGSGLTHENRITPADLSSLLRNIYFDPTISPELLSSLAVAGIDGTIRNRFLGTPAVGLVRAKTGTLSGVSALSGYLGERDDVLAFTIFVEGFRHRQLKEVRHAQVRLVEAMLQYLRADIPNTGEPDSTFSVDPSDDSEADGDPDVSPDSSH